MTLVRFDPFQEITALHRQVNRLLEEIYPWNGHEDYFFTPPAELRDNGEQFILKFWIPGVDRKDLDISVTRDGVTISGQYRQEEDKDSDYYLAEFSYGKFERHIDLPVEIENDKVTAEYKDGVLTLTLPKVEEARHKIVKIHLASDDKTVEAKAETVTNSADKQG